MKAWFGMASSCWVSDPWRGASTVRRRTPDPRRRPERLRGARHTDHTRRGMDCPGKEDVRSETDCCTRTLAAGQAASAAWHRPRQWTSRSTSLLSHERRRPDRGPARRYRGGGDPAAYTWRDQAQPPSPAASGCIGLASPDGAPGDWYGGAFGRGVGARCLGLGARARSAVANRTPRMMTERARAKGDL